MGVSGSRKEKADDMNETENTGAERESENYRELSRQQAAAVATEVCARDTASHSGTTAGVVAFVSSQSPISS